MVESSARGWGYIYIGARVCVGDQQAAVVCYSYGKGV